jgi:hypothetical protein
MRRSAYAGKSRSSFSAVSLLERRQADDFYADLLGRGRPARADEWIERAIATETETDVGVPFPEDGAPAVAAAAPTIRLSAPEVLVCVGGINNATVSAITTGGGTVTWRIGDPTRASVTPSGATATIKGLHPGITTVEATLRSGSTTVTASARLLVCFVQLLLRNSGTIVPTPKNEDAADEATAAGGTTTLGPLPMGTGRADFPGATFTAPIMVVGRVFPGEAARRFQFRWQRLIHRRSWRIRRNAANTRWNVTFRTERGPLDDDTGDAAFNDATPATPGSRIFIYDNSGILLTGEPQVAGEFVHERKDFIYRVSARLNGVWTICSAIHVGQIITARRTATTGTVATDWTGVENSNEIRRIQPRIAEAQVRAIVGGADPIDIAAGANP